MSRKKKLPKSSVKKKKPPKLPLFPHYWMCWECAEKLGGKWPKGHCATVTSGICKYCDDPELKTIIPWVDFNWPGLDTSQLRD